MLIFCNQYLSGKQSSSVKAIKTPVAFCQPILRAAAGPFLAGKDRKRILTGEIVEYPLYHVFALNIGPVAHNNDFILLFFQSLVNKLMQALL
jgi:hypothetical protein